VFIVTLATSNKPKKHNKMKNTQLIKTLLETTEVKFTIKGMKDYGRNEDGKLGLKDMIFKNIVRDKSELTSRKDVKTETFCAGIGRCLLDKYSNYLSQQMNVDSFGKTYINLYDFGLFGNKITEKIKYEDITIIEILSNI
tara:strand:- start:2611 stop:3030 length:420 start_codon:yes stop_codon:yes gene_type:complete